MAPAGPLDFLRDHGYAAIPIPRVFDEDQRTGFKLWEALSENCREVPIH